MNFFTVECKTHGKHIIAKDSIAYVCIETEHFRKEEFERVVIYFKGKVKSLWLNCKLHDVTKHL